MITNFIWDFVGGLLDKALGQSVLNDLLRLLTFTNTDFDYTLFWNIINNLLQIITPFGFALITTYFLIHMFDIASKDQMTIESIVKILIQLILAVAVIGNLELIINTFLGISETMFNSMTGADDLPTMNGSDISEAWKAVDPDGWMGAIADAILLYALNLISKIAISFAAISRIIEIGWKTVFAPIGAANVFEGGASSPGIKYLKGLFATIISSVALYVIAATGFALSATFLSSGEIILTEVFMSGRLQTVETLNNSLLFAGASLLATAGASIGVSNKIKEVIG